MSIVNKEPIDKGRTLLKENPFFFDLVKIMKNTEFKTFYDEYFKTWSDIQCMIFYMKLYSTIEYEYKERYHHDIPAEVMVYALHNIMIHKDTRQYAMKLFKNFEKFGERTNGIFL